MESLGPTVGQKRSEKSTGVDERLAYLLKELEVANCTDEIRYQLLHRTVSALVIGKRLRRDERGDARSIV